MKKLSFVFVCFALLFHFFPNKAGAATGITLFTPYTGISVTPGESIDYSFDLINHTNEVQHVQFTIDNLPKDWKYEISSGGWNLDKLSVKPNETEDFTVTVDVPLKIPKNTYTFQLNASSGSGLTEALPMSVTISEKGTFKTELTSDQPNMQGHADASFEYELSLDNRTSVEQHYALTAEAPRGWDVNFKVDSKSVTSVTVESNGSKDIDVHITPPAEVKAGTYEIPVKAGTNSTSATQVLEAVIQGNFDIKLSTPSGRLSESITAGDEKTIELEVTNTGSVPLRDITLEASKPANWDVMFEPSKIVKVEPGKSETVEATIKASENAIAGDYVVQMDAKTPEVSSTAQFRMQVKTSMIWGWIGVLIIAVVLVGIYYVIRKYGRR